MSKLDQIRSLRVTEIQKIQQRLQEAHDKRAESIKGGENMVAFVHNHLCIGCDQCLLVCDDDAIEMINVPLMGSFIQSNENKKAKILRDPCTGCRLCVLSCPTDAITMIER